MRSTLLAIFCLLCWNSVLSQQKLLKAVTQETNAPDRGQLSKKLKDWKIFRLEGLGEAMQANTAELVIQWDKNSVAFKGQHQALTDENAKLVEIGPGYRREHAFPKLVYFNGKGIRMTIGEHFILGEYMEKGKKFIVEQLGNFIPGADKKQVVVYASSDLIGDLPAACGADASFHAGQSQRMEIPSALNAKPDQASGTCRTVDIAVMANSTSYAEHNSSVQETAAYIASIYNLSEGDYTNAFTQNFSFKINELVVSTSAATDPWKHTDDIYKNLENFWFFSQDEFRSTHDLSSYWFKTNSFSGGVIGLAYMGFTCNTVGDAAIREFKGSAQTMRTLLSHELGHNFNMSHDAAGAPFIMAPSINGSKEFSDASKSKFESFISSGSAACIVDCNFDTCERTLIGGLQVSYQETKDEIQAGWAKVPGSQGYIVRWWERGSGQSKTAMLDSNTTNYNIPLTCSNTLLYRVEVANICSNGQAGTYTGVEIANSNIPQISLDGPDIICGGATTLLRSNMENGNQWYRDGVLIAGATGKTFSVSEGGSYTVRVTRNGSCTYTSNDLFIIQNTSVERPRLSASGNTAFCEGSSVLLTSTAANSYQWLLAGVEIAGEKNRSILAKKSGQYTVRAVLETGCTVLSDTIQVTAFTTPEIPVIVASRLPTLCPGDEITMSSNAAAGNQWYRNNTLIPGAVDTAYKTTVEGSYTVKVTNQFQCSAMSSPTVVSLAAPPSKPAVTATGPLAFCAGNSVVLQSDANDGNQWLLDGALIIGATNNSFSVNKSGRYTVRVTNAAGCTIESETVPVIIHALPAVPVVSASGNTLICEGSQLTLTSNAGSGNQWFKNGEIIAGATGESIVVSAAGSYSVRVSNTSGCSAVSTDKVVTVSALPLKPVVTAGGPLSFCAGSNVVLTSDAASGNQWLKDGAALSNATGKTLQVTESGAYSVRVSNANGCLSEVAGAVAVTVNANPAKPPISWNGTEFSTLAGFPGYKWFRDGVEIAGAAANVYRPTTAGNYKTTVIDVNACTSSSDAYPLVITGVDDIRIAGASIVCFPNPAREAVYIQVNQSGAKKIRARLIDLQGRIMFEKILSEGRNFIPTGQLPSGIYLVQLTHETEKSFIKILVTK